MDRVAEVWREQGPAFLASYRTGSDEDCARLRAGVIEADDVHECEICRVTDVWRDQDARVIGAHRANVFEDVERLRETAIADDVVIDLRDEVPARETPTTRRGRLAFRR